MNKEVNNKKAQVTIFIILAILIVLGFLIYFLVYPKVKNSSNPYEDNPPVYIENCIKEDLENLTRTLSLQGGSLNPTAYSFYNNTKIQYVCYTEEYYRPCVIQKPLIDNDIKKIMEDSIKSKVNECFNNLKNIYEKKGYNVQINKPGKEVNVEILPQRIETILNYSLTLTKGETRRYDSFKIVQNNNLYELLALAVNIIDWESKYGNAPVEDYMMMYPEIKVERLYKNSG
ncbi:hypothetical protein GYA25_00820, partial [Candidatus Woesearchaeota archaeon]|nr:hypothetical protein [Candidatus Woesearchaeota archaeon]